MRAAATSVPIVNHSELPSDWNWLAKVMPDARWHWSHVSALDGSPSLPTPLRRMVAAHRAVARAAAGAGGLLVSHGPRPAMYAQALAWAARRQRFAHLAFSFNFTELPKGARRRVMARACRGVDRYTVFSTLEQRLYPAYFDLDPARFDFLPWAVQPPAAGLSARPVADAAYVCAVGSQGRDYAVLMAAMRRLPQLRLHVVVHPANLAGLDLPANVTVHTSTPLSFANALIEHADAMVLPLAGAQVPCGHVTAVTAMHLGKAIVATDSTGLHDYLRQGDTAWLFAPHDAVALAHTIEAALADTTRTRALAARAQAWAAAHCTEAQALAYLHGFLTKQFGAGRALGERDA